MDVGIIGGADGPTAVYLTSSFGWLELSGFVYVVLILLPSILFALKHPGMVNQCKNKFINILEQIGRYGCMLLMVFDFGMFHRGYSSVAAFLWYYIFNTVLVALYWICWIPYWRNRRKGWAVSLAVLPALIFFLSGITAGNAALSVFAVLFCVAHVWVTLCNH